MEDGGPKLFIVVVPVLTKQAVKLAYANKNDMRRDLENEDNGRIAILAHDEGVVTGRQSNVAGTSLWGSSQGEVCFVNSGSSEQLESIEPVAHAAGTVDSQDGSGLVM